MTAGVLVLRDPGGRDELKRWGIAAAVVVAAHCSVMASYLLAPTDQTAGAPSAPAIIIDLSPEAAAPLSQADLAPGPDMVEAPQVAEQKPPDPQADAIPKVEAPAEVTLPEKEKTEKPPDEIKPVEKTPPAPQTTAAPRSEQRIAPQPKAPSLGSEASRAALASWRDLVVARLQSAKRYPSGEHAQGTATLSFSVDRNGRVLSRNIVQSSGVPALDHEVLAMIQRAQPLPSFPAAMSQSVIHLTVPVRFSQR